MALALPTNSDTRVGRYFSVSKVTVEDNKDEEEDAEEMGGGVAVGVALGVGGCGFGVDVGVGIVTVVMVAGVVGVEVGVLGWKGERIGTGDCNFTRFAVSSFFIVGTHCGILRFCEADVFSVALIVMDDRGGGID